MSWVEIALIGTTFLTGGLVKGTIGLGLPVVVLALLAPVFGLKDALALFLVPALVTNVMQALQGPALAALIARLWPFLLASVVGIGLGVRVLASAETGLLEAMLGALLIAYSALSLSVVRLPPPGARERWMAPVAGGSGGVLFGMVGIFIIPGILYLETLRLPRDVFVQALGLTFITISGALAVAMGSHGLVSETQALASAGAVIPTVAGLLLGRRLRRHVSETGFRKLFFVGLIGAGGFMIWRGLLW
ncbi:MAG: sulfite exporter TauE/SafE family protein [Pikeienuella sp.]